jgi:ATP-dependent DNA ligase
MEPFYFEPRDASIDRIAFGLKLPSSRATRPTVFAHACKLALKGIASKCKDSIYRSGRSPDWLKFKNPAAPAVKREEEEDWGK